MSRSSLRRGALVAASLFTLIPPLSGTAGAVTTRTWRVTTYRDFDEGEASGVLLSSLGEATAGFTATRVDVAEAQVYAAASAPDGTVWLGTGDGAEVYRYDGRQLTKAAKLDGVLVAALAAAPDGSVYAGTIPSGKIFKVQPGVGSAPATAREVCKLEGAEHVWGLVLDGQKGKETLYAATGPAGKLFAIDVATGRNRVLWDSGEKHLLALASDGRGGLYAGSADEAILYHVKSDGSARAIADFDGDELRGIAVRGNAVYVAVNEFEKQKPATASASATARPHGTRIVVPSGPFASATSPGRERKGKGAVYRVDGDGRVEQLHALGENYFTAISVDQQGDVYAAAGSNGRVYLVKPDHTVVTAFDLPERQVLALALDGPHKVIGTGDAGALYSVELTPPKDARYVSKVFDAGFVSRWGAVRWSGSGDVGLETRSGNTARPDKTWSAWQPPRVVTSAKEAAPTEGKVLSPEGRYLQFRATFAKQATLRDVTTYYLPQNQRARVTEITVGDDPGQRLARAARMAGKPRSPVVKVKWKVENPDDDELDYRLFFREESEVNWKPLGGTEPLTQREWEWNTESIPDGNYVLKVVASDERANPKEEALDHSLVSTPFLVDNRKPEVAGVVVAFPFASGVARDSFSPITELAYSLDGGEWQTFAPKDAIFDDPVEDFTLRLPKELGPGAHSLAIRAVDAADNVGATQLTFRVK